MNVSKPNKLATVATLLATGASQHEIARLTGVAPETTCRLAALGTTGPEPNSPAPASGSRHGSAVAMRAAPRVIEAPLRLCRTYTSIYQDLVDQFGFTGRYNSVKRFAGRLVQREPERFRPG